MEEKLQSLEDRYNELAEEMGNPEIFSDQNAYQKIARIHSSLEPVVNKYRQLKKGKAELQEAQEMLELEDDAEFTQHLEEEIERIKQEMPILEAELRILLLPKDPNDDKSVIIEIRGGAGGDEAALFASILFRMYARYAERMNWKIDIMNSHPTELGGFKEISFAIEGFGAYSRLKFESGVHRVQRIPSTESGGRIHTSTVTVAVLPEAEEVDVQISENDVRIDVFCASGPGGQCVNTTQSAVRITHLPTGITVSCQDEKSQHKNKDKAMKVLRARVLEKAQEEAHGEQASLRKSQVGTGDRSERIRTYNFPQNRVSDHRIGLTLHKLDGILEGDLDETIDALVTSDQAERMKQVD